MSIIETVPDEDATGAVAQHYAHDLADQGFVAAHTWVMALNPGALEAWEALIGAIAGRMSERRYEPLTLAAALGARSRHCRLAHGRRSPRYIPEAELIRIARDYHDAGLSAAEVAMMEFAEKVSADASSMTDADSRCLRETGFADSEIVDIALAAAARNHYGRAILALAVEVEKPEDIDPELRRALVVGL